MKSIKFFDEKLDVKNKKIILRTDFNVPIINNEIKEKTRIDLIIPFIQKLLSVSTAIAATPAPAHHGSKRPKSIIAHFIHL